MAEDGASTNGHRPARRRKHIYPPQTQMAAEQAAAANRPRPASGSATRTFEPEVGTDTGSRVTPEPAIQLNGHQPPARKRKRIYPPQDQMAAEKAAAAARRATAATMASTKAEVAQPERGSDASPDFGPEAAPDPAPPVMAAMTPTDAGLTVVADDALGDAESVELRLSAVGMIDAADVTFAQGALGAARADNVSVDQGAIGAALAQNVDVSRGYARSILARQVQLDRAAARVIVAADVKAERSAVMLLVARKVSGDVKVLLDWRGAVAFGAVAGVVMGLLRRRSGDR
jgi:hypothetical protein